MKSNSHRKINKTLPPLTVPPAGEPQFESHAALTSSPSSTQPTIRPSTSRNPLDSASVRGVKRAASSSTMQHEDAPDSGEGSARDLEKKRNKLGYHRTSVACTNCRRRKIRCLVDAKDPQGRCSNCLRLKKECNFFPVDQQPTTERQRRPAARASSQPSSSPAPPHTGPDHMSPYPPPPLPLGYTQPPMGSMQEGTMQMGSVQTGPYQAPLRSATWDPQYMDSPMSAGAQMSDAGTPTGVWRSPIAGEYPVYGAQAPDSARSAHFPAGYGAARQDPWGQGISTSQTSTPVHHLQGLPQSQSTAMVHSLASSQAQMQAQQHRSMSLQHDNSGGIYGGPAHISDSPYYDTRGPPSLYASPGSPATSVSLSDGTSAPGQTHPATVQYGALPGHGGWDPTRAGMEYAAPTGWYPDPNDMSHGPEGSQGWGQQPSAYKPE